MLPIIVHLFLNNVIIVSKYELTLNKKGDALLVKNINFKGFGKRVVPHISHIV